MLYSKINMHDGWWDFYILRQYEDRDGGDNLSVRVEKESDENAFADWRLPDITCEKSFGFSEDDLLESENFLRNNESIMWDMYREQGAQHASSVD